MNEKTYVWNNNNFEKENIKTWDMVSKSNSITWGGNVNDFGKWAIGWEPTEQEMIEKILTGIDDEGFFRDILDWLKKMAPKKVPRFLEELYIPINSGLTYSYESLCEIVYKFGFRASEVVERRMILGTNNKWVQDYFKDFS